jgi:hypothetical protein
MTKNSLLIPTLIGLGLVSLVLSIFLALHTGKQKPGEAPLARIELNSGKVFILLKNMTQKEILASKSSLFALDSVETGPDGEATMEFDSLYRIRIEENSMVTLDLENERTVLIIKRGELHIDNIGRENTVFISRDGVQWDAHDYEQNYKTQSLSQTLPDTAPQSATPPTDRNSAEMGLNSESIQETIRQQRNSFYKCYTQLLQRTPGVVGNASISFTIQKSGKVSNADLAASSINDGHFKKCIIEVIRRTEFKSFAGDPISTVFPLKFE